MSNRARRRHLRSPRENRMARNLAKFDRGLLPSVPGVIPDREPASINEAMEQAHHVLPYIPGTQVCVRVFDVEPGLDLVRQLFGEEAVPQMRDMLLARGGSNPGIVIATRDKHEENHDG